MEKATTQVLWTGDVEGDQFGYAFQDVSKARGKPTDAPATRPIRLEFGEEGIRLGAFCPDLMLWGEVLADHVRSAGDVQVAIGDPHKIAADMFAGMRRDGGDCHLELIGAESGGLGLDVVPQELVIEWGRHRVVVPVAEGIAPANFGAVRALLSLQAEPFPPSVHSFSPSVLKRLGTLGKYLTLTYYGDRMPIAIGAVDGIGGAVLATVLDLRSENRDEVATRVEIEAVRFLNGLRKTEKVEDPDPTPADDDPLDFDGADEEDE